MKNIKKDGIGIEEIITNHRKQTMKILNGEGEKGFDDIDTEAHVYLNKILQFQTEECVREFNKKNEQDLLPSVRKRN